MNKKLFEDIGKRVKKRRIELGYTQEYLAEKMDVSIQMISGTESGKKALKLENFIKFCEILETTPDYLIKGRDPASILIEEMKQLTDTQIERINAVIKQCIEMCKEQNEQSEYSIQFTLYTKLLTYIEYEIYNFYRE